VKDLKADRPDGIGVVHTCFARLQLPERLIKEVLVESQGLFPRVTGSAIADRTSLRELH
jgi:hypothetical protein